VRSLLTLHGVPGLSWAARSAMWRQRAYYFYSYRAGRHPMLGGIWQRRVLAARREVLTDEGARGHYLGGGLGSAGGVGRVVAGRRRRWLDPHEVGRRFGASPRSLRRAARWLRARGLRVRHRFADRTLIQFDGPPAAVAAAFDVRLGRAHGRFRSSRPPLLHAELGALDVLGLDGVRAAPRFAVGPAARTTGHRFYISPADFRRIYGLDAPAVAALAGAGQRISIPAIGDADGAAVANFRAFFGLPPTT